MCGHVLAKIKLVTISVKIRSRLAAILAAGVFSSAHSAAVQPGGSSLSASSPQQYLERGEHWAGVHDYDGAIADYNKAIQLKPVYAEAYNDRGHAYHWKGDTARAIADFTRAIELRPDYPNAYNNRGAAYMASGRSEKAIPDFDRALELKPDFRNAYVNRANAHLRLGHVRQALDDFHGAGMRPERAAFGAGAVILLVAVVGGVAIRSLRRRAVERQTTRVAHHKSRPTTRLR